MKTLLGLSLCCWVLAVPVSSAQAAFPLSFRGGLAGGLSGSGGPGGHLSGTLGWYTPEEFPPQTQDILELYLGAPYIRSFTSADGLVHYTDVNYAIATGIRLIGTTHRIQPVFALHGGLFPSVRSSTVVATGQSESTASAGFGSNAVPSALGAANFQLNTELGVRAALTDRAALGLLAAIRAPFSAPAKPGFSGLVSWQLIAHLSFDVGALRPDTGSSR